jgi:hypothetical protein
LDKEHLQMLADAVNIPVDGDYGLIAERPEMPFAEVVTFIMGCGKDTFSVDRALAQTVLERKSL